MTLATDLFLFLFVWAIAQSVFRAYEAHVSKQKRLLKLAALLAVLAAVHLTVGRIGFYAFLGLLTAGMILLHGYWFHCRHGIHWRTAEPKDRYLTLIGAKKNSGLRNKT